MVHGEIITRKPINHLYEPCKWPPCGSLLEIRQQAKNNNHLEPYIRLTTGKNEKVYFLHVPAIKVEEKKQLIKKKKKKKKTLQNYDFCEYVQFGAISLKFYISSKTAYCLIKVRI